MAETPESRPTLDGVQRIYFEENGQRMAVITTMAQTNLEGAHLTLAAAPVVDGGCLGMALCQVGIAVLRMVGSIDQDQLKFLTGVIADNTRPAGSYPLDEKEYPF